MKLLFLLYRLFKKMGTEVSRFLNFLLIRFLLAFNKVDYQPDLKTNGLPVIRIHKTGCMQIGNRFRINNGKHHNQIGRQQPCYFIVGKSARLIIGNNVAMSGVAIVALLEVSIGNNVKIGGNTVIYDSDFHSLNFRIRQDDDRDINERKNRKVCIGSDVFIGAHSIILKGVRIGDKAIIGSGSVVTKDVPENQVWAGNPARFIRELEGKDEN